jgi:TPR repeat protein
MKTLLIVAPLAGLLIGCAQPPFTSTGMRAQPVVAKRAPATAPDEAVGSTMASVNERLSGPPRIDIDNIGDSAFRAEQEKGANGDPHAALRVAEIYKRGASGVAPDERRMVQWLLHASALNNGAASYQLYQYYLQLGLDREAVFFENRAISQGYTLPVRLDPRRS